MAGEVTMRFTKMQGCGNDYVYLNCFELPLPKDPAELARKMPGSSSFTFGAWRLSRTAALRRRAHS